MSYRVSAILYVLNFVTPALSGLQLAYAEVGSFLIPAITLIHLVFLVWSLILFWKNRPERNNPVIIIDLVWGVATFFALLIAIAVGCIFLKTWADNNRRNNEEAKMARVIRKAFRD